MFFEGKVDHMFKRKEKMMNLKQKRKALIEALHIYSAQQLQLAIRLGILPVKNKLIPIPIKNSGSEMTLVARKYSKVKE